MQQKKDKSQASGQQKQKRNSEERKAPQTPDRKVSRTPGREDSQTRKNKVEDKSPGFKGKHSKGKYSPRKSPGSEKSPDPGIIEEK